MRSFSRLFLTLCLLIMAGTAFGQTARVQIIHNIPSAGADSVDIYVNGALAADNLNFRTGTPYVDVDAGTWVVNVNGPASADSSDAQIFRQTVEFLGDSTYVVIAQGTSASPVLNRIEGALEAAPDTSTVSVILSHGIPDGPPVRVFSQLTQMDIVTLPFGFNTPPLPFPAALGAGGPIGVDLIDATDSTNVLMTKLIDLINLRGVSGVVLASGLLNPGTGDAAANAFVVFADGTGGLLPDGTASTSIEPVGGELPGSVGLSNNFPNPFNPTTNFEFTLDRAQSVKVVILDITGKVVDTLADGELAADTYRVSFDATGLSSGTYFYQIKTADRLITKKMLLMK